MLNLKYYLILVFIGSIGNSFRFAKGASRIIEVINSPIKSEVTSISPGTVWYLDQSIQNPSIDEPLGIDQYLFIILVSTDLN